MLRPSLSTPLLFLALLAFAACADERDGDLYDDVPPDVPAPAAGDPDVATGLADDDVVPGPLGNVPLDDFLLDPEAVAGPYAEAVMVGADAGEAVGAALFVPDERRGLVLYYRVGELPPGDYGLRLGRDCGSEGATLLGTAEPRASVASGQLLLEAIDSPEAAAGQVLMVMNDAGQALACGPISMVNVEAP